VQSKKEFNLNSIAKPPDRVNMIRRERWSRCIAARSRARILRPEESVDIRKPGWYDSGGNVQLRRIIDLFYRDAP
jgi:hypothetical protein